MYCSFRLSHLLQSFTFSGMTNQMLQDGMHITSLGFLDLKGRLEPRITETSLLGCDQLWCSDNMYRHRTILELQISRTVCQLLFISWPTFNYTRQTEASARAWINTFFFRAMAMVPPTQWMVLNMEYTGPPTRIRPQSFATISGRTYYTAIIAKPGAASESFWLGPADKLVSFSAALLTNTQILSLQKHIPSGFFVAEGKSCELARYVPQAVTEIYGCTKIMQYVGLEVSCLCWCIVQKGHPSWRFDQWPRMDLPHSIPQEGRRRSHLQGILRTHLWHSSHG